MNNTKTNYDEAIDTIRTIYYIKNQKYGDSFDRTIDQYGPIAGLTRISDKFHRMENLILTSDEGTDDESLHDTLLDMANYCLMFHVALSRKEGDTSVDRVN